MSRVKLNEHKSKQLLYQELEIPYDGVSATITNKGLISYTTPPTSLAQDKKYVVKVDQGIKGRMKKGLVKLQVTKDELINTIEKIARKGYFRFIIEEMLKHDLSEEKYISIERVREGLFVRYAAVGGIDIESMQDKIKNLTITNYELRVDKQTSNFKIQNSKLEAQEIAKMSLDMGISKNFIQSLIDYFEHYYVSFLEINPLVVKKFQSSKSLPRRQAGKIESSSIHILDLAVEVDSTAQFFVKGGWSDQDVVQDGQKSPEEVSIKKLSDTSQAALSFTQLNKDGSVWVLLSGGGASITIADEFYNLGHGKALGNYGEYSGNPNAEETYLYTKEVLNAMFRSKSKKKIILIGGGVANFTDIRVTFSGIARAFEEVREKMKKSKIQIYVRRGGPHEKEGLKMIEEWMNKNGLSGYVAGPELPLYEIVRKVVEKL